MKNCSHGSKKKKKENTDEGYRRLTEEVDSVRDAAKQPKKSL